MFALKYRATNNYFNIKRVNQEIRRYARTRLLKEKMRSTFDVLMVATCFTTNNSSSIERIVTLNSVCLTKYYNTIRLKRHTFSKL